MGGYLDRRDEEIGRMSHLFHTTVQQIKISFANLSLALLSSE